MKTISDNGITPFTPAQQEALINIFDQKGILATRYKEGTVSYVVSAIHTGELNVIDTIRATHGILCWVTPAKGGMRVRYLRDRDEPKGL